MDVGRFKHWRSKPVGIVPVEIVNSIVYLNGSSPVLNCPAQYSDIEGSGGGGTGNLDVDPGFVSLVGGNFSLQPTSQCIDKGADNPHTVIDLAGTPRKKGAAVDLGAYEVQ